MSKTKKIAKPKQPKEENIKRIVVSDNKLSIEDSSAKRRRGRPRGSIREAGFLCRNGRTPTRQR